MGDKIVSYEKLQSALDVNLYDGLFFYSEGNETYNKFLFDSFVERLVNKTYPIGYYYYQFSGQSDPYYLQMKGTWQDVTSAENWASKGYGDMISSGGRVWKKTSYEDGGNIPKNIDVSYREFEGSISITWDNDTSAVGYKIIRDVGTAQQSTVLDGTGYTVTTGRAQYIDSVSDNLEHTYILKALFAGEESVYTSVKIGRAYRSMSETIDLYGYASTIIMTAADGYLYNLSVPDISGARGGIVSWISAHTPAQPGGKGLDILYEDAGTSSHSFFFGSGRVEPETTTGTRNGGQGFYSGEWGRYTALDGPRPNGGGGGASVIKIDGTTFCGAGGGAGQYNFFSSGRGAGPGGNIEGLDDGRGYIATGTTVSYARALVNTSAFSGFSFTSTPNDNNDHGKITATLTWRE